MEPVNRSSRDVLGHAADLIVVCPAVPAIQIAFVFDKQIRRDGMKISGENTRSYIWIQPPAHGAMNQRQSPVALQWSYFRTGVMQLLRILRKYRIREHQAHWFG